MSAGNQGAGGQYAVDNLTYDLITLIHEKSKGLEAYEKYLRDAQRNQAVSQLLEQLQQQDQQAVQQLTQLLSQILGNQSGGSSMSGGVGGSSMSGGTGSSSTGSSERVLSESGGGSGNSAP